MESIIESFLRPIMIMIAAGVIAAAISRLRQPLFLILFAVLTAAGWWLFA